MVVAGQIDLHDNRLIYTTNVCS